MRMLDDRVDFGVDVTANEDVFVIRMMTMNDGDGDGYGDSADEDDDSNKVSFFADPVVLLWGLVPLGNISSGLCWGCVQSLMPERLASVEERPLVEHDADSRGKSGIHVCLVSK